MLQPLEQQQERLGLSVLLSHQLLRTSPHLQVRHLSFPTILSHREKFPEQERWQRRPPLQHLIPPPRLSSPQSHGKYNSHTSRNCKSPVSAASFTHHPPHGLIYKAISVWQNSSHGIQTSVEQTAFLALAPFPSGCSGSGTDAAPRMSSSLFQVGFALGNLPGNQNKLLLGL